MANILVKHSVWHVMSEDAKKAIQQEQDKIVYIPEA